VLYLGRQPVPHAADAVQAARGCGMRVAFVTNNASRSPVEVAHQLTKLGIAASAQDVVTSGQAAVRLVLERVPAGSAVLVLGSQALVDQTAAAGLRPVRTVEEAGAQGPAAVLQGLSPQTSWSDLAEAAVALSAGALWVAGNTDTTLPSPRGPLPGNGALVQALRTATGCEPLVAGKPAPALHRESVVRTAAQRPLVVGDRLDTDVLGAVRAGTDSLLVLTGVVDLPMLLHAPLGSRPTYVSADLRGLLCAHPKVERQAQTVACGRARAHLERDVLRVELPADGDRIEGLRAACTLAWDALDGGQPVNHTDGVPTTG